MFAGLAVLGACSRYSPDARREIEALMELRSQRDRYMASAEGPLLAEQRGAFKGLAYFKPDLGLVFDAALEVASPADTVHFVTSTGTVEPYVRAGTFHFDFAGPQRLDVFRSAGGGLFLPFGDTTNGTLTYAGGRYVDLRELSDGRLRLDFNRAYNPYCAYNARWVCPLPPAQNRLAVAVRAGERTYPYGHEP